MTPIRVPGCRHDVLGHNLKAIGLLRALATCVGPEHRDIEAEGWWDLDNACFYLRSEKYQDEDSLIRFFAEHYRPTPIFSPWNTGGGLDEKQELVLKVDHQPVDDFLRKHDTTLREHGYDPSNDRGRHSWKDGKLTFDLKHGEFTLPFQKHVECQIETTSGRRPKQKVVIRWAPSVVKDFSQFLVENLAQLEKAASVPKATKEKLERGQFSGEELRLTVKSLEAIDALKLPAGIVREIRTKTSGEKATIAILQNQLSDGDVVKAIEAGRRYFPEFQAADSAELRRNIFESFRENIPDSGALAMDAVLTSRTDRISDNPIFLDRGKAGNSEIFRSFWSYFLAFKDKASELVQASLFPERPSLWDKEKSPGTPFFPDAVKTYNNGLGWVVETFPFNALDYLLAVEGAVAMRGAVSRTLAANSRRFAAFPFVFDSGEDLVDDSNEVKGTASSIWLPLWDRRATVAELTSFICDAQARLPGKEARFSAEFARALRAQGVDAGFKGWQEFRFKMNASRVPWVCTGRYLGSARDRHSVALNDALAPLDESGFLDQFEPRFKGNKIDSRSPHPVRAALNSAVEQAVAESVPENAVEILIRIYTACRQMALSESFREKLRAGRAMFFEALPQEPWENLLQGLEHSPEFRVARALASIAGFTKQWGESTGKAVFSEVQPLLGSLLPLKRGPRGWYLPTESKDRSKQAVWSGADLCHDLARVLSRRYLDSRDDDRPAVMAVRTAPLEDILAFLNGELDDHRIARLAEALSLIGWRWKKEEREIDPALSDEEQPLEEVREKLNPIPLAYAALRSLLEMECEWQGNDLSVWKKRRSQRPVALLCQRTPSSLALSVEDALRWLSIWGVPNCWGEDARREKLRLAGRDIIRLDHRELNLSESNNRLVTRLAAAVLIPLDWRARGKLYRAVTLPQSIKH